MNNVENVTVNHLLLGVEDIESTIEKILFMSGVLLENLEEPLCLSSTETEKAMVFYNSKNDMFNAMVISRDYITECLKLVEELHSKIESFGNDKTRI